MKNFLSDEQATINLGKKLAQHIQSGIKIYVRGELGAGKTTLVRSLVQALGHKGRVKSPTYTLIEPYEFSSFTLYHLDLYRIHNPEELDFIGLDVCLNEDAICVIEWPEQGSGRLPLPDVEISLQYAQDIGREVTYQAHTDAGKSIIKALSEEEGWCEHSSS